MRAAMQKCVKAFIENDIHSALLLVDIGVWPFRDLLDKYPKRVKNIGIFEPGTVSLAAGLSLSGILPTVYGISPFIAQRALEQIKLDFAYQKVRGNFIVTGASYDFSTLGYSHYCPEDAVTLSFIPGVEIVAPGTPTQFEVLWESCHNNNNPTYFRMTDHCNVNDCNIEFGKATVLKRGKHGTVICVAEMMDKVLEAARNMDVTVLYYSTIAPFDGETLRSELVNEKLFICAPFYKGSLMPHISEALAEEKVSVKENGIPLEIPRNYGTKEEKDNFYGLTTNQIEKSMDAFFFEGA